MTNTIKIDPQYEDALAHTLHGAIVDLADKPTQPFVITTANVKNVFDKLQEQMGIASKIAHVEFDKQMYFFAIGWRHLKTGEILNLNSYRGRGRPRAIDYVDLTSPPFKNGLIGHFDDNADTHQDPIQTA